MPTTYLRAVASLDGYIADEHDDVGPLHDWYFSGDHPLVDDDHPDVRSLPFRVSAASADYVLAPRGVLPLRHLGGEGHGPGAGAGRRGGDRCGRG